MTRKQPRVCSPPPLLVTLLRIAEEVTDASFEAIFRVLVERLKDYFGSVYACLHFTEVLELSHEEEKAALFQCPVPVTPRGFREEMIEVERRAWERARNREDASSLRETGSPDTELDHLKDLMGFEAAEAIPLVRNGRPFAVLNLFFPQAREVTEQEREAIALLGGTIYGAVRRDRALRGIREGDHFVLALARTIEAKDISTAGHLDRVMHLAEMLGRTYGLRDETLKALRKAAILHDVGKVGIPEAILNKPGPLTAREWAVMKRHPEIGVEILGDVKMPWSTEVLEAVLHHHERWDGSGYPRGLAEEGIPLFGRLIAVVDGYDALTSPRPYREALSEGEALRILREGAGTQWDPHLVRLFLDGEMYVVSRPEVHEIPHL